MLVVLSLLVALFAFTFGVHLGKRVPPKGKSLPSAEAEVGSVRQISDQAPTRAEAQDKVSDAAAGVSKTLDESLKEEVASTGISLDKPIQVELPSKTRAEKKGQKTEAPHATESGGLASAVKRSAPEGAFTVQVLAAPVNETARLDRTIGELAKAGLHPWVRRVDLPGKGSWYRIYHGGFSSPELAEKAASALKSSGKIQGYVVVKMPAVVERQSTDAGTSSADSEDHSKSDGALDE